MLHIEFMKVRFHLKKTFEDKFEAAKTNIDEYVRPSLKELRNYLKKKVVGCVEDFKK
jgi:ribosomal protein S17E